jgi:hypothetical protein
VAQHNTSDVGVTVLQMRSALQTLYNMASNDTSFGNMGFPFNPLDEWLRSAVIFVSQKLSKYPPDGIIGLRRGFSEEKTVYRRKEYRLDVDNLAGHNLRQ